MKVKHFNVVMVNLMFLVTYIFTADQSKMIKTYQLDDCNIKVSIKNRLICIYSNKELWSFLDNKIDLRLQSLIKIIKIDYQNIYNKPLNISTDSLIVEIVIHVYCDYLGLKFNQIVKIGWVNKLVNKLLKRTQIIDCGESKIDSNRWLWDFLSKYKFRIFRILPKKISHHNLKTS